MGSIEFSGASLAGLAVDPAFADASGKYLQSNDGRLIETQSSAISYDEERALQLWIDSKSLVHLLPEEKSTALTGIISEIEKLAPNALYRNDTGALPTRGIRRSECQDNRQFKVVPSAGQT